MKLSTDWSENVLTRDEVAALFRVHPSTVSRWAKSGTIRSHRLGGRVLFLESDMWLLFDKHLVR